MQSSTTATTGAASSPALTGSEETTYQRGLHLAAKAFVVLTFVLIASGGLVTSRNAGMAVPDWPTSFGRWLLLPVYLWADLAVMLEHNHRINGALAGLMSIFLVVMTARGYGLGHWRSRLAMLILVLFVGQGLMGGLRVTEVSTTLAIIHGVTGQIILGLTVIFATVLGVRWCDARLSPYRGTASGARPAGAISCRTHAMAIVFVGLILTQLVLGAVIRHTQSASAIPDAPLVYGSVVPPLEQEAINEQFEAYGGRKWSQYVGEPMLPMSAQDAGQTPRLLENTPRIPASPPTVGLLLNHYAHRVLGMVVLPAGLIVLLVMLGRDRPGWSDLRGPVLWLVGLFAAQVLLGLSVIWSRENPEIATGHQAVGAALLGVSVWLVLRTYRLPRGEIEAAG